MYSPRSPCWRGKKTRVVGARVGEARARFTTRNPKTQRKKGRTPVVGDSAGRVQAWFKIRNPEAETEDGSTLVMAHSLVEPTASQKAPAVTSLATSGRTRSLAVGSADGVVKVFYVSNEDLLVEAQG